MNDNDDWAKLPVVNLAGREFRVVPRAMLPRVPRILHGGTISNEYDTEEAGARLGSILMPVRTADDKLEFPGGATIEGFGPYLKSGISQHRIGFFDHLASGGTALWTTVESLDKPMPPPTQVTARELDVFEEDNWYGECFYVLTAHGWFGKGGGLSADLIERTIEAEANPSLVADAGEQFGDNAESYLLEVAAKHFTAPLSRLWYAANMMSLYYAHGDDMRLGYFWAEYQIKMRAELFALKHIQNTERNRENGAKGGQAARKHERYQVLDQLMTARVRDFFTADDRGRVRLAKALAAGHDKGATDPLFWERGKDLRSAWYQEWVDHFRHQIARSGAVSGT